jgi:FKBP-type peptidyl-prolyl cis-trans isomerase
MKLSLSTFTLTAALAALPVLAQNPPPVPVPPPPPAPGAPPAAAQPGQPPAQPGLLPPPATPAVEPDSFKTEKERQSYALGLFFANNLKQEEQRGGSPLPKPDELLKGMKDVLSGVKSLDYVIGAHLATQIQRAEVDLDAETLSLAVREALTNVPPKLNPQQSQEAMKRLNEELAKKKEAKKALENAKALEAANKFLETNGKAKDVKQTPSGLQYVIEKQGEGKSPTENEMATLNFKCSLLDTTLVERSPETGPARKAMRSLPKGLQEGLALLKTGSKAKFWIPPALGYGEAGRLGLVKANAVLVYEVELLGVEPMPKPAAMVNPAAGSIPGRPPVTAVTPPITVEIPPKPGEKPAPPLPPVRPIPKPGQVQPPVPPAPTPPPPPPATPPPATPEKK